MSDTLVKLEGVSKKFCKNLRRSMLYGMFDIGRSVFRLPLKTDLLRDKEFWSVDNVSFELKRGECLGLIGPNGAGKSTLLKILNGIISPDKGRVEMKGKVGSLIEISAGFHPMLTGRENIYIKGSILGFRKKEIDKKFDEIVEFAELAEFIDTPVKHYSSGMYVRLGFSIAAQMEPDVLLIDEILAVGDVGFKAKCFNAISRISNNAAIILVSHAMPQVARVCTGVCVMNRGKAIYLNNDVPKGIELYYSTFKTQKGIITGNGRAAVHKIEFESKGKKDVRQINYLDDLTVHLQLTVDPEVKNPVVGIAFLSREQQIIAQCNSLFNKVHIDNTGGVLHIKLKFPEINLNPSLYSLSVHVSDENRLDVLTAYHAAKDLLISGDFVGRGHVQLTGEWDIKQESPSLP